MPRDSLAEIMAAEQVLAAKQQLHACSTASRSDSAMRFAPGAARFPFIASEMPCHLRLV